MSSMGASTAITDVSSVSELLGKFDDVSLTGRSNWILHRKLNYSIFCLRDVIVRVEIKRDLSNGI